MRRTRNRSSRKMGKVCIFVTSSVVLLLFVTSHAALTADQPSGGQRQLRSSKENTTDSKLMVSSYSKVAIHSHKISPTDTSPNNERENIPPTTVPDEIVTQSNQMMNDGSSSQNEDSVNANPEVFSRNISTNSNNVLPESSNSKAEDTDFSDSGTHFNLGKSFFGDTQNANLNDFFPEQRRENRGVGKGRISSVPIRPLSRPLNVSRAASPHYPWGSHAFGPLSAYERSPMGTRWNAYFYEQTAAVVLETDDRTVLNCTLLEVIPEHEMRAALRSLGQVMALVPLTLRQMLLLSSYCRSNREWQTPRPNSKRILGEKNIAPERLLKHASTALMGILPGTVWCGLGDRARVYHQLGERPELDNCCRMHDHCPVKLRAGTTRYGVTNNGFSTVSHCLCDDAFRVCLEEASKYDELAPVVGNLFFNIMRIQCLARPRSPQPHASGPRGSAGTHDSVAVQTELSSPGTLRSQGLGNNLLVNDYYKPRLECAVADSQNGCRLWMTNPKSRPIKLEIISPKFRFNQSS